MLFQRLPSFSALLLVLSTIVAPSSVALARTLPTDHQKLARIADAEDWTNAQRLAAHLPPHAPRHVRRGTPTEPNVAKRNAPSPSPSAFMTVPHAPAPQQTSYTGLIEARTVNDDTTLGFVRLTSSGVILSDDIGTPVAFNTTRSTPFSIATISDSPVYIGALGTSAIAPRSARKATLGSVRLTAPHARPMATGGESAIWKLDTTTQRLTAHWVNPDGSHPKTNIAYSPSDNAFVLTGGIKAYNRAHTDTPLTEVALYFSSN